MPERIYVDFETSPQGLEWIFLCADDGRDDDALIECKLERMDLVDAIDMLNAMATAYNARRAYE